jgi:DNA-binding IclR family transcriptional regulator
MAELNGPKSVSRSLRLLLALADAEGGARLADLSERLDLPVPTVHRLLQALIAEGFALQDLESRRYELGPSAGRLADVCQTHEALRHRARPVLERVMESCGETVFLTVRSGDQLQYVDTVMPSTTVRMVGRPGDRDLLHATSQGKVLLAFLPPQRRDEIIQYLRFDRFTEHTITDPGQFAAELERVRAAGFAIQDEEREVGIRAVAAPVLDPSGYPVAALCIGAPAFRVPRADLVARLGPLAVGGAREIAARLYASAGEVGDAREVALL